MPLDLNGVLFQSSNSALNITASSVLGLDISSSGVPLQPKRPFFVAAHNVNNWIGYNSAAYQNMILNTVLIDILGNYNTTNGRFTAPVTGTYHFQSSFYTYKNTATNTDSYIHPMFRINDSTTGSKQANQANDALRLRQRTNIVGAYAGDQQINDIFYLTAGDYVNVNHYSSSTLAWYGIYAFFSGFLIG